MEQDYKKRMNEAGFVNAANMLKLLGFKGWSRI